MKENYKKMMSEVIETNYSVPEDTSIPIYDLNFTFLQTINFGTHEKLVQFLTKWELCDFKYKNLETNEELSLTGTLVFDDITNEFGTETANSIVLKDFYNILFNPDVKTGQKINITHQKEFFQELFGNIDLFSPIRYLTPIGNISELRQEIISAYSKDDSHTFSNEHIYDIEECFKSHNTNTYTRNVLPQNVILNLDTRVPLFKNKNLAEDKWYSKYDVPSAYCNIFFLKNNRTPHYNIDYIIPDNAQTFKEWEIETSPVSKPSINLLSDSLADNDLASGRNTLFDFDITHSYEINVLSGINIDGLSLNKKITQNLINYAAIADTKLATENTDYSNNYPIRMENKKTNYLEPYKNYHIAHNKLYNVGELYGLRNYSKVGALYGFDKLWFSYKYKTIFDRSLIDNLSIHSDIYFHPFVENRLENHWIFDEYHNKISNYVMKYKNTKCPWVVHSDFSEENKNKPTQLQQLLGCQCPYDGVCSGFCTFPMNNALNIPAGASWRNPELNYQSYIVIPSANTDTELYTETDIDVSDDLEIYFVSGEITEKVMEDLINMDKSLSTISGMFLSIFGGFGGKMQGTYYSEYLATSNAQIKNGKYYINNIEISKYTPFNGPHTIVAGTKLMGLKWENKNDYKLINYVPAGYNIILRVRSWWSDTIKCTGKIKQVLPALNKNTGEMPDNLQEILKVTSKYDYVERNFGFFKYKQEGIHKSNIYSVKLNNSGLNPENDNTTKYYSKQELIQYLCAKNSVYFDNIEDTFFKLNWNSPLPKENTDLEEPTLSNDNVLFKLVDKCEIIPFNEYIYLNGFIETVLADNSRVYYNKNDKQTDDNTNNIRQNIRNILEEAIRKSLKQYMPAETQLWKIFYTGK